MRRRSRTQTKAKAEKENGGRIRTKKKQMVSQWDDSPGHWWHQRHRVS